MQRTFASRPPVTSTSRPTSTSAPTASPSASRTSTPTSTSSPGQAAAPSTGETGQATAVRRSAAAAEHGKAPDVPGRHPTPEEPRTPEEAVIGLLMQAGRRLRSKHPEDEVEPSCFPLAKLLFHDDFRVSDLAAKVELDTSTVSRQIRMLEDRGIVERTADPADGRASIVRLTDDGRHVMRAAFQRRFDRIRNVLEPWSQRDRDQLRRLLTRLAADLRAANDHEESRSNV